jgi:hypothetical protein
MSNQQVDEAGVILERRLGASVFELAQDDVLLVQRQFVE